MRAGALVITGGTVVDGTGAPGRRADVAIDGGRVVAIAESISGERRLDARGMIVAPGFIDIHTHDDFTLPLRPEAEARVRQGTTTTVTGNCGFSTFPLDESEAAREHGAFFEPDLEERWSDLPGYARELAALRPAVNVAPLVGFGAVRLAVMGEVEREPTDAELGRMRGLVGDAMNAGAFGGSSGLVYSPGCFSTAAETVELTRAVAGAGGFYATHMRDEAARVRESVQESIEVARETGCPVHISHHKAIGRRNWGVVTETLGMIDLAVGEGLDVSLDAYPYTAGSSTLLSLLPASQQDGGIEAIRERIGHPEGRAAAAAAVREEAVFALADVVLALVPSRPGLEGSRLVDVARASELEPEELVLDLIDCDGEKVVMVAFGMDQRDVDEVLAHPRCMVGSDGWVQAIDQPGSPHPRNFSTTARFLVSSSRERGLLDLPTAVRKLTGLPAARLRLDDRGTLEPGQVADVTVFDFERMEDLADFTSPAVHPTGIEHVLVGGEPVLEDGEPTGARPGSVLARRV
ncbi:MAG: D-aminoacylase [Solirubrobacterales bacterium]